MKNVCEIYGLCLNIVEQNDKVKELYKRQKDRDRDRNSAIKKTKIDRVLRKGDSDSVYIVMELYKRQKFRDGDGNDAVYETERQSAVKETERQSE